MKRDIERARQGDQPARAAPVHGAVGAQQAQHHTVGAQGVRRGDVAAHDLELDRGIAEVPAARADHDIDGDAETVAAQGDGAGAGRGAALDQVVAQLDAARAAALSRKRGPDRVHTGFDENAHPLIVRMPPSG